MLRFSNFAKLFALGWLTAGILALQPTGAAFSASAQAPMISPLLQENQSEDWTKLTVDRAKLKIQPMATSLGSSETATYTSELIRLTWLPGDPIDMYVIRPKGVTKPPVALYLYSYSYPADLARFRDGGWCQRATRNGTAAVGFLTALTGDRMQGRPLREWFIPELQEGLGHSVRDVQMIIDYLAARGDLNTEKVGMFGQGSGASVAILAAAVDPRIQALDLINPWGDWPDWLKGSPVLHEDERPKVTTPQFLHTVSTLDPVDYLPKLKGRSLRVQQILDDQDTPAAARDKIAAAVPAGDLVQYKDTAAHREAWKATGLSGWLSSHISQPARTQAAAPTATAGPGQR